MRSLGLLLLTVACGPAPETAAPMVTPATGAEQRPPRNEWQEGRPVQVPECALEAEPELVAAAVRRLRRLQGDPGAAGPSARFVALDPEGPNAVVTHAALLAGNVSKLLPWIALVRRGRITAATPVMEEAGDSPHRRAFESLLSAPAAERDPILDFLERALPVVAGMTDPFAPPTGLPECTDGCRQWLLGYLDATAPTADARTFGPEPLMLRLVGALRLVEAEPRLLAWIRARRHFHQLHTDYTTQPEPVADGFAEAAVALAVLARSDPDARGRIRTALVAGCAETPDAVVWFSETHDHMDGTYDRSEPRERRIGRESLAMSKRPLLAAAVAAIDGVSDARWQLMGVERAPAQPTWQVPGEADGMEVVGDWLCRRGTCLEARTGQRVASYPWTDAHARVETTRTFGPSEMVTVLAPLEGAPRRLVVIDPSADALRLVAPIDSAIGRVGPIERVAGGYVLRGRQAALLLDERGRRRSVIDVGAQSRIWIAEDGRAFVADALGMRLYPPGWQEPRLVDLDARMADRRSPPRLEGVAFAGELTILGTSHRILAIRPNASLAWTRDLAERSRSWVPCGEAACVVTIAGHLVRIDRTGTVTADAALEGDTPSGAIVANDTWALLVKDETVVAVDLTSGDVTDLAPIASPHMAKLVGVTGEGAVWSAYGDGGHQTMLVPVP